MKIRRVIAAEGVDGRRQEWTRETIQCIAAHDYRTNPIPVIHIASGSIGKDNNVEVGRVVDIENRNRYVIAHIELDATVQGKPDIESIIDHLVFRAALDQAEVRGRNTLGGVVLGRGTPMCVFVLPKSADGMRQCWPHDEALKKGQ